MISVICPVYNDIPGLTTTIKSLLKQDFTDYEIIIGDNNSTDGTKELAYNYSRKYNNIFVTFESEIKSSYANRNKALDKAQGDIIAFIDADMFVPENWLSKINDKFKTTNMDYIGCNVKSYIVKNNMVSRYDSKTAFPVEEYINEKHFAPTCCLCVRKSVFDHVGYFDHNLISSGDCVFGQRVYECGFKVGYADDILMYHPARSSFISIAKKAYRIGKG